MELTPLDLQNQPVLAAIGEGSALTAGEIAEATGRDPSNLRKSLKALAEAKRVEEQLNGSGTGRWALTRDGVRALAALARAANEAPAQAGGLTAFHDELAPDPDQPRKFFDEEALDELGASILLDGLLQDITVREGKNPEHPEARFIIVAGERRWRAIGRMIQAERLAEDFPIGIKLRELDEAAVRRIALIENLQRKDLKPLEEARAIEAFRELTGATTEDVAGMLNRTRRFVQRRLQLLKLSAEKMKALETGKITLEEAWRWLDNRPTAPELPPRQWLIALEVLEKALREPIEGNAKPSAPVEVGPGAEDDEDRKTLATWPAYMLNGPYDVQENGVRTGRYRVYLSDYGGVDKLKLKFGEEIVTSAERRSLEIAALRKELGIDFPLAEGPSIDWLKGPFEVPQAVLDGIAEEIAEEKRRREEHARAAEAVRQRQAATLARVQELETRTRDEAGLGEVEPAIQEAASAIGWTLPVTVKPNATILDAAGVEVLTGGWHPGGIAPPALLAKHKLLAIAINAGAGLATPEYLEPKESDGVDMPRADFVRAIADCLLQDDESLHALDDEEAETEATRKATAGLAAYLADEGIEYGAADYDWSEEGAMSLAEGIRVDGLGQTAGGDQVDLEDAIQAKGDEAAA